MKTTSEEVLRAEASSLPHQGGVVNDAALTEAVRHVDVVHTSLAGMTAIVAMLLAAVALPVFELQPVKEPVAFWIMTAASFIGIGGLYLLNFRVHQHVTNQARLTEVLVNSLGQGFAVFDASGVCGSVYSQACLDLLETVPAGKSIADVLRIKEEDRADFKEWLDILFQPDHALGFEDVVRFFPSFFPHGEGRRVALVYRPVRGKTGALKRVVVIATDQTEEYAARQSARRQENFAEMICRIFKDRNQFQTTISHVREFLADAKNAKPTLRDAPILLRRLHTLKATVKQFNLVDFAEEIHAVEGDLRDPEINKDSIFAEHLERGCRKISEALLRVTEQVSSLIGTEYEWRGNVREIGEDDLYAFAREMENFGADAKLIDRYLDEVVAVPIRDCFRSFEREIRELAAMMDKQVKPIQFLGSNPRVLARPMQEFLFSLTHIGRNIMDHGIESPVTRMARGKDAAGQVTISCDVLSNQEGRDDILRIVIADDGNGIDPSRVRAKLSGIDPEGPWRFEDDQTVIQRIFSWGFTTRDEVTAISGRGVGTEAVEVEVKKLGGTIRVSSELYKGSSFEIRIPYKLNLCVFFPSRKDA